MTTHICDLTPPDGDPETAHALLYRCGLPEDVIDGALNLHAHELAAVQRRAHDERRPYFHMGMPCTPGFGCHVGELIDLIDPTVAAPAGPAGQAPATDGDPAAPELTAQEARYLADELGTELYRAQDALAFVEECCVIADRTGRQPTTADVREWLKGARCGRQLLADATDRAAFEAALASKTGPKAAPKAATDQTALRDRIRRVLAQIDGFDFDSLEPHDYQTQAAALAAVLPASVDRADVYAEVADRLAADAEQGAKEGFTRIYRRSAAKQVREWGAELRRVAAETRNTTPPAGGAPQPKQA